MEHKKYFVALDGMRGVAAIMVLLLHTVLYFSLNKNIFKNNFLHDHVYLLVDCFYIISGFVVAHTSDKKMQGDEKNAGMTIKRFIATRVLRLYPMVILGVILGSFTLIALSVIVPQVKIISVVIAIISGFFLLPTTALQDFRPWAFPANSPHWSLSFEMILCIGYVVFFKILQGRILIICAILAACWVAFVSYSAGNLDIGYRISDYLLAFGRVTYPFMIGVILRRSDFVMRARSSWGYVGILLLPVICLNSLQTSWYYDTFIVIFVLPPLIWLVASAKPVAMLDRWSKLLGEISYPLYAIHFPIVVAGSNIAKYLKLNPIMTGTFAFFWSIMIVFMAYCAYRFIDVPIRAYLGRTLFLTKTSPSLPSSSALR